MTITIIEKAKIKLTPNGTYICEKGCRKYACPRCGHQCNGHCPTKR